MKILMYSPDSDGGQIYSGYLIKELRKKNIDIELSDTLDYNNFDIVHIQFEHMVFHPFGFSLIPKMVKLKMKGKKIIITSHTILARKEIYARNKFFTIIKKILLPLDEKIMGKLYDKIIVHTNLSKEILKDDYNIQENKIEVIPHGIY